MCPEPKGIDCGTLKNASGSVWMEQAKVQGNVMAWEAGSKTGTLLERDIFASSDLHDLYCAK